MEDEGSASTNPSLSPPSPGEALAMVRNQRSLSVAELSMRTKISADTIRAIEEDRFETLPPARVYIRGFIRAIAHELALDPDETTAHYLDAWQQWMDKRQP